MRQIIDQRSRDENRAWSRLPLMSDAERRLIRGSADFLGLNYYTSSIAEPAHPVNRTPSLLNDREVIESQDPSWPQATSPWLRSVPQGLREMLK